MRLHFFAALFALGLSSAAAAQEPDAAEVKKRILDKVRRKLELDRTKLLNRIALIIEEELDAPSPAPKAKAPAASGDARVKDLERRMRLLEEQKEVLAAEIAKEKRLAADEPLREEARKEGPHNAADAKEMFDNALELHEKDKNYRESIRLFKRIYYQFPRTRLGSVSAYNVACGHALAGQKDEAIDWLELSIKAGYNSVDDIDHLRQDPDLASLRNEKRYQRLLTDR